jgi:hypothetical protein
VARGKWLRPCVTTLSKRGASDNTSPGHSSDGRKRYYVYTSNSKTPPLPPSSRILRVGDDLPSSNCWRNYEAVWEIKDGALYLRQLKGMYRLSGDEPILANHFTGFLFIPQGSFIEYVHDFCPVFSQELCISVKHGEILDTRLISTPLEKRQLEKTEGNKLVTAIIDFTIQVVNFMTNLFCPFKR